MSDHVESVTIRCGSEPRVHFEALREWPTRLARPAPGAVDVWRLRADTAPVDHACLSAAEERRRDRFAHERDRARYTAARAQLRLLLGAYLDVAPADVPLATGPRGKPALARAGAIPLEFNLAHTEDDVAIAICGYGPVGIDLERVDRACDHLGVARHSFHANEEAALRARAPDAIAGLFFRWWTAKEAVLKAWGLGIGSGGLAALDFSAWTGGSASEVLEASGRAWGVWHHAGGGCALAVAATAPLLAINVRSIVSSGERSGAAMTRSS